MRRHGAYSVGAVELRQARGRAVRTVVCDARGIVANVARGNAVCRGAGAGRRRAQPVGYRLDGLPVAKAGQDILAELRADERSKYLVTRALTVP